MHSEDMHSGARELPCDYDYVIIGSGFGGSVSALRLTQKGYRVAVLESGRRWDSHDFPATNWNIPKFFWFPRLFCTGIQRIQFLRHVGILSGAGVGGGSLVYAATLYRPLDSFYRTPLVAALGGESALAPHFDRAEAMLGKTTYPFLEESDELFRKTGEALGIESTFRPTDVGIYFGPGEGTDPYFQGEGPPRSPCLRCGGCMVGCRYGAKNSLDKNYLYLAERGGARIFPEHKAVDLIPLSPGGGEGYEIRTRSPSGVPWHNRKRFRAREVILAAGVLGNLELLLRMGEKGRLVGLSPRLGRGVRTNSESLLCVTTRDPTRHLTTGSAITCSLFPDSETHVEPVRYPVGSDVMGFLFSLFTRGKRGQPRQLRFLINCLRHPLRFLRSLNPVGFARRSLIVLGMQSRESSLQVVRKRRAIWPFRKSLTSLATGEERIPSYIPEVYDFTEELARTMGGTPGSSLTEVLFDMAPTAHILGGCVMGRTPEEGVVDTEHRLFGYKTLRVVDGSVVPANPGVNPSLTITALAERAMELIPPAQRESRAPPAP